VLVESQELLFFLQDLKTGKEHNMTVYGGFLGAKLNDDNTIGTEYFYAATFDQTENKCCITSLSTLKPGVKKNINLYDAFVE
jgi:hypothetical protein